MRIARSIRRILAAAAIATPAAAAPQPPHTYAAKLTFGGTFVEESEWDTGIPNFDRFKGKSIFSARVSESHDLQIQIYNGAITAIDVGHKPHSATMTASFHSDGTLEQFKRPQDNDKGSEDFSGAVSGDAGASVVDDFAPDGGNLSFQVFFHGVMTGVCKDDRNGANCAENTAAQGQPSDLSANGAGKGSHLEFNSGGSFFNAVSARQGDTDESSTAWKGMICSGNPVSGWQCHFAGTKVGKTGGITETRRVDVAAEITILRPLTP